jgi:hypothetical protein
LERERLRRTGSMNCNSILKGCRSGNRRVNNRSRVSLDGQNVESDVRSFEQAEKISPTLSVRGTVQINKHLRGIVQNIMLEVHQVH